MCAGILFILLSFLLKNILISSAHKFNR